MQFSVSATNGHVGTRGVILNIAGVKGAGTTVIGNFEKGVVGREMAQAMIDRVMARVYELVGV